MRNIAIIGTGYVGLSTGACLASIGHTVSCVDIDASKVEMLQAGQVPIVELGLDELVAEGLQNGNLCFVTDLGRAVTDADVVFLCLPTPQGNDGSADLSYIWSAVRDLAPLLKPGTVVVNKSTVPVGTAAHVKELLGRHDVDVVSNPEFLRQGTAVLDFLNPSRVVVGGQNPAAVALVASLYEPIDAPILTMGSESAEMLKYAANAFLATKVTFINAVADVCEAVGADILEVAKGIGMDPRIGSDMLRAGPGWGGSCFPKDTRALVSIAAVGGYDFGLLRSVIGTNEFHYTRMAQKIVSACGGSVDGKTIAVWGLTFKAGTDDLRDSPSIKIVTLLRDAGAKIQAYDPTAKSGYETLPWIDVQPTALDACHGADVLALLTEWPEFRDMSPHEVKTRMNNHRVVDARNLLDREEWRAAGFEYRGVGR